jgi:hypothetical protein
MRGFCRLATMSIVALLLFGGCGGGDDGGGTPEGAAVGSFVGLLEGTDAHIAIVSDGEQLAGYVCDSKDISIWFQGDVGGTSADVKARTEQDLGEVDFLGDTADGEIEIDGEQHSFSAELAVGDAGLYRAFKENGEGTVEVGWVLLNDGSQRGGTNFIDPNLRSIQIQPAPMLDPKTPDVSVNVGGNAITLAQMQVAPMVVDPIVGLRR